MTETPFRMRNKGRARFQDSMREMTTAEITEILKFNQSWDRSVLSKDKRSSNQN
jgi:lysozyme family protein